MVKILILASVFLFFIEKPNVQEKETSGLSLKVMHKVKGAEVRYCLVMKSKTNLDIDATKIKLSLYQIAEIKNKKLIYHRNPIIFSDDKHVIGFHTRLIHHPPKIFLNQNWPFKVIEYEKFSIDSPGIYMMYVEYGDFKTDTGIIQIVDNPTSSKKNSDSPLTMMYKINGTEVEYLLLAYSKTDLEMYFNEICRSLYQIAEIKNGMEFYDTNPIPFDDAPGFIQLMAGYPSKKIVIEKNKPLFIEHQKFSINVPGIYMMCIEYGSYRVDSILERGKNPIPTVKLHDGMLQYILLKDEFVIKKKSK